MSQRNPNIDVMRVLAAFAVVWLHVSVRVIYSDPNVTSSGWWVGNIIDSFSRWSVPLFVMVSGALSLSAPSSSSPIKFWIKRGYRLIPAIIFWTLVFFAFRKFLEGPFGLKDAIKSLIEGNPYGHLWYLYMLIGLTFVTPFLQQLVGGLSQFSLLLLIVGSFTLASFEALFGGRSVTFLPSFLPFIGYFLAGHYLTHHSSPPKSWLMITIILICGFSIALGTGALLPLRDVQAYDLTYSYHNPLVVVMSLCVFLAVIKTRRTIGPFIRIAPLTLGVYVIHPLWLWALSELGMNGFFVHPIVGIPITAILVFSLSVL